MDKDVRKGLIALSRFERILGGGGLNNNTKNEIMENKIAENKITNKAKNKTANTDKKVEGKIENKTKADQGQAARPKANPQDQYWKSVLINAYFLRFPAGAGSFISMKKLYEILDKLRQAGAGLTRVEERPGPGTLGIRRPGKISRLKLEQGRTPQAEWNRVRAKELPGYREQLRWLFTLSAMGAAAEYVDLGVELPAEWVDDTLKKYGQRIQELREAVIAVMIDKNKNLYFEIEGGGKTYCLAPGKTGRRRPGGRPIVELTPEEAVLVAEAQEAGLLEPGVKAAQGALRWIS